MLAINNGGKNTTESPLEAAAGTAGPRAIEAFSVLGNETRLSVLLTLWDAYEPWDEEGAVPFSELRERLGRPDSGRFNCKQHHQASPWWLIINRPAVVAFYYDRGIPLQFDEGVEFQPRIESHIQPDLDQELVSEEPLQVRVTIQRDGDRLQLTLGVELDVIDVCEPT